MRTERRGRGPRACATVLFLAVCWLALCASPAAAGTETTVTENTALTYSVGTFTQFTPTSGNPVSCSGTNHFSTTASATISHTVVVPADGSGVLRFYSGDSSNAGSYRHRLNGGSYSATVNNSTTDCLLGFTVSDLGPGTHTVEIQRVSGTFTVDRIEVAITTPDPTTTTTAAPTTTTTEAPTTTTTIAPTTTTTDPLAPTSSSTVPLCGTTDLPCVVELSEPGPGGLAVLSLAGACLGGIGLSSLLRARN